MARTASKQTARTRATSAPRAKAKAAAKVTPAAKSTAKTAKAPRRQTLMCELDHSMESGRVQLTWRLNDKDMKGGAFFVVLDSLRRQTNKLRDALAELEGIKEDFKRAPARYASVLRELAKAGDGFARLVTGVDGPDETRKTAAPFSAWFQKEVVRAPKGTYEILVIHKNIDAEGSKKYVAPWHLAYSPGPGENIDDLQPTADDFVGFWGSQFRLAVLQSRYVDAEKFQRLEVQDTRVSAVLEVDRQRTRGIQEDIILHSPSEFVRHSQRHRTSHNFYYVLLRADGDGAYRLAEEELDRRVIERSQSSVDQKFVVITMFDGDCIMRDRTDWVEPLLTRSAGGLIVAETDILNTEKRQFGWEFMKMTIEHAESLVDAISHTRRALWPRSLIYGLYCNARHVYVAPVKGLKDVFKEIDDFMQTLKD